VLKPNAGRILLEGNDITDLPVHIRVLRGLSRTFQINQLYADLTPLENHRACGVGTAWPGGDWWRRMGPRDDVTPRSPRPRALPAARRHDELTRSCLTASSACWRSRLPSRQAAGAAAR